METRIEITVIKENDIFNAESARAITDKAVAARDVKETEIANKIIEQIKSLIIKVAEECDYNIHINISNKDYKNDFNNDRIKNKILNYFKKAGFKEIETYVGYNGWTYLDMKW